MSGPTLGRRGLERLKVELSGRDYAIVGQVADLRLMSARHIEAIHFAADDHQSANSAARCCRRVLERLVRDRLLIRLERRIGGIRAGSASYIYAIGPVGQRVLSRREPRARFREPSTTFALHTLAIAQLITDLTLTSRTPRLDLLQLQPEPACWRSTTVGLGSVSVLRPDLFVAVGIGDFEHRWFIEVDLGTEHLPTLLRKCHAYNAYYRTGSEQAAHDVFPKVLWIMHTHDRAERLIEAIARDSRLTTEVFTVTTTSKVMDVLAGEAR